MSDDWRIGDHRVIDDITGFKIWASESRKQWNGSVTDEKNYSPRHQQDLIRARRESPGVLNARPEPPDSFVGPLTTTIATAAAAGATALVLKSSVRMEAGDHIVIMLSNGDTFRTIIATIPDAANITITTPLPHSVSVGAAVIDNTAMSASDVS